MCCCMLDRLRLCAHGRVLCVSGLNVTRLCLQRYVCVRACVCLCRGVCVFDHVCKCVLFVGVCDCLFVFFICLPNCLIMCATMCVFVW